MTIYIKDGVGASLVGSGFSLTRNVDSDLEATPACCYGTLMGGLTLTAILYWLYLDVGKKDHALFSEPSNTSSQLVGFGLLFVVVQLILGGWTSATYSGPICATFPLCEGSLWPEMNYEGFYPLLTIGKNYQGGHLVIPGRVAIQMVHRYWHLL